MKRISLALLIAASLLSSAYASNVGPASSWSEIRQAGLIAGFSSIFFGNISVSVDELCVDGQNIRPIQPNRTVCVEFGYRFNQCVRYETRYLSAPLTHSESRCVKYNHKGDTCIDWESVTVQYPTSYRVTVYEQSHNAGLNAVFNKAFDVPYCQ
ncbi:MAG TPA: hypothetical protein DCS07_03815 [Bdellovibrionales bacterium]|nr:MAG: hypothetical protein A2X97_05870 [Bdellovibrionales bacterium GWA1_52_35]OFZ41358.1 MAG: hypothetical protein A2070_05210 [Bdellovibrionales bacterium GWC1_52_8]HAR41745.1 hypothetical protein [Bdellovibrionales bacterium]HCM41056.1 hypothetical protein [Bdellovibrionales bacterium]